MLVFAAGTCLGTCGLHMTVGLSPAPGASDQILPCRGHSGAGAQGKSDCGVWSSADSGLHPAPAPITPGVRWGAVPSPRSVPRLYMGLACHLTELPRGQCPGVPRTSPQGVRCPALRPGPCLSAPLEPCGRRGWRAQVRCGRQPWCGPCSLRQQCLRVRAASTLLSRERDQHLAPSPARKPSLLTTSSDNVFSLENWKQGWDKANQRVQ